MSQFEQGQKVAAIIFPNDDHCFRAGHNCESITVVMENGQMSGVPWFEVVTDVTMKYNGALLEGVELL